MNAIRYLIQLIGTVNQDYLDLTKKFDDAQNTMYLLIVLVVLAVSAMYVLIYILLSRMPAGEREPTLTEVILERNKPLRWPNTNPPKDVQGPPLVVKARWKRGDGK